MESRETFEENEKKNENSPAKTTRHCKSLLLIDKSKNEQKKEQNTQSFEENRKRVSRR